MADQYLANVSREGSLSGQRRENEPAISIHWGSVEIRIRPRLIPGEGWSDHEWEAAPFVVGSGTNMDPCNVAPIILASIDQAIALLEQLTLTCELPAQWQAEAVA